MNTLQRIWKDRFTTKGLTQRVLRKTVQKNTWIYVSDKNYNVFVGIKETGYFQHSSPTAGGLVTSAGLIKVENGLVTSLSPLSGHYRTSVEHYRQFLDAMQKKGLDLSHVHVTKEEVILWGLERWTALAKSVKGSKKKVKGATWRLFHPKQANEADKEKEKKRIQEQDSSEQPKEAGTETGGHEETDADKAKHKALTERMQQIKERGRKEDEHWQTGSQWRWEIITGRAQQVRKQGERKWKDAMETISPGESGNASHSKPDGELSSPAEPERPSVLQNPPSQTNAESSERPQSSTIPRLARDTCNVQDEKEPKQALNANSSLVGSSMSSLDHQDRPNSAIYLGSSFAASQDQVLHPGFRSQSSPLLTGHHIGRLGQLPSPPHTNSTSGSGGDKDSANAGSIRGTGAPLLTVVHDEDEEPLKMQNGKQFDYEDDDDDLTRRLTPAEIAAERQRITPKIERVRSLVEKNQEMLGKLNRYGNLGSTRSPSSGVSPTHRTASLGRTLSAASMSGTGSMRHSSVSLPRASDVFDPDAEIEAGNQDMGVGTTPAMTPSRRGFEISPRQRLVSEPTSPNRINLLRQSVSNTGSPLRRVELGTVEEGERKTPATSSAKKSRTPIPLEFMGDQRSPSQTEENDGNTLTISRPSSSSRQPSPGLYTSEGSPSLSPSALGGPNTMSRRPRPAGLRNSYDRWGEPYERWEKSQLETQPDAAPETEPDLSQRRAGLRSVVNEGLKAAGLTRTNTTSSMRRRGEDVPLRSRTISALDGRPAGLVASPSTLDPPGTARLSTERDRSRSRLEERSVSDMESLRERSSRHAFFSPNIRAGRTIHNVLNNVSTDSPNPDQHRALPDGRETPANLRSFKNTYSSQLSGTAMTKAYTSPSGLQRHLPIRASASNAGQDSPKFGSFNSPSQTSISLGGNNPVQLLQDALYMFESHVQKLPQSTTMGDTYNDVLRDAKGIVGAAAALNIALRGAAAVCVDEQIEAEVETQRQEDTAHTADIWRKVAAEFREGVKVSDELVRALTSFMIGSGRMLRSASTSSHSRMTSGGDASSVVGSISRAGGTALTRGGSTRGGSSDGRRSVEGWSRGVGLSGIDRRSVDGRQSVDGKRSADHGTFGGSRRSAEDQREDQLRRLVARQGALEQLEGNSAGSGGSVSGRDRPGTSGGNRVTFHGAGESRSQSSLSVIRDVKRLSQGDALSSPGPRTFTSLSSRRSTGAPTPATSHKALPKLPLPPADAGLSFPQSQDGGDRTPIELPRPHVRHSTMPPLAVPPPLPTLPSESIIQRSKTISKHVPSNSITSGSTTTTATTKVGTAGGSIRHSTIGLTGESARPPVTTPTTAKSPEMTFSDSTNPFSMGRSRGNTALNGLQQVINSGGRKRTGSTTDDEGVTRDRHPTLTSSGMPASSSRSSVVGRSSASANSSPHLDKSRPSLVSRRTSSTLSGANSTVTSPGLSSPPSATLRHHRVISRMSSAGTLGSSGIDSDSRPHPPATDASQAVDSGAESERRLRRSRVRLSVNAIMDKRGGIGDILSGRRLAMGSRLAGDREHDDDGRVDLTQSPSAGAHERRERRLAANPL
ncbi:hypothetical protein FRC14_005371 [Serendipita sp. 396]|nr:hypothetical protein FRC14_005371 [Serendipita sp. 396]